MIQKSRVSRIRKPTRPVQLLERFLSRGQGCAKPALIARCFEPLLGLRAGMTSRSLTLLWRVLPWLVALLAAASIVAALAMLWRAGAGVQTERTWLGPTPVTVYRPDAELRAEFAERWEVDRLGGLPVVVIAHGFAGSQQLMQAFAVTLARNGYIA